MVNGGSGAHASGKELGMVGMAGAGRGFSDLELSGLDLGDETLTAGDAARITDAKDAEACAVGAAELLVWEMRSEPVYG